MKKAPILTILLGDKIITKDTAECGADKKGIIVCLHPENDKIYGVEFNFEHESLHKLQNEAKNRKGFLTEKHGLWLEQKDFNIAPIENKSKRYYNHIMYNNYLKTLQNIPNEIKRCKDIIASNKRNITENEAIIKNREENIIKNQENIAELEKKQKPVIEDYQAQFDKLKSHSLVEDIIANDTSIIIKTKDIIYHHKNRDITDFNIGAYYIYIPTSEYENIKAINYKKQLRKGAYFHPCIKEDGNICMGNTVKTEINKLKTENNLLSLVYLLLNFFKEPNYAHPYIDIDTFRAAQPVTYKPTNIIDYLYPENWLKNEKWNENMFLKTMIKNYKADIERFKTECINLDYIDILKQRIENYKLQLK